MEACDWSGLIDAKLAKAALEKHAIDRSEVMALELIDYALETVA